MFHLLCHLQRLQADEPFHPPWLMCTHQTGKIHIRGAMAKAVRRACTLQVLGVSLCRQSAPQGSVVATAVQKWMLSPRSPGRTKLQGDVGAPTRQYTCTIAATVQHLALLARENPATAAVAPRDHHHLVREGTGASWRLGTLSPVTSAGLLFNRSFASLTLDLTMGTLTPCSSWKYTPRRFGLGEVEK